MLQLQSLLGLGTWYKILVHKPVIPFNGGAIVVDVALADQQVAYSLVLCGAVVISLNDYHRY